MIQIEFQRNLIGVEDMLFGFGQVTQTRGKAPVTVTRMNSSNIPFSADKSLHDKFSELEIAIDSKIVIDGAGNILTGLIESTASDLTASMPGRLWIKEISGTESWLYHEDQLILKFNPTAGNIILETSLEAYVAADAVVTAAFQAADTALDGSLTTAYQAADTALSGSLTTAYQAADTALQASITAAYQAAIAALPTPGTTAGSLVQLDGDAKLPAVDGSLLTNLSLSYASLETTIGFGDFFQSADYTFASGSYQSFAHGLGKVPRFAELELVCTAVDGDYAVGDVMKPRLGRAPNTGGFGLWFSATHIGYSVLYTSGQNHQLDKEGLTFHPNVGKWKLRVKAWA